MNDWIKEAVERIRQQDAERKHREESELFKVNLLREKAPLLWQQLWAQLEDDAQQLNAAFHTEPHRHMQVEEIHPEMLVICKPTPPVSRLHLHFNPETYTVSYEFEAEWGEPPCQEVETGTIEVVTAHNNVYFGDNLKRPEDVSRQLLGMFLNAEGF